MRWLITRLFKRRTFNGLNLSRNKDINELIGL